MLDGELRRGGAVELRSHVKMGVRILPRVRRAPARLALAGGLRLPFMRMDRRSLPPAIAAALHRFKDALEARFGDRLRELTLFGSQARGDAHEESDVDVLVVIQGLTETERRDVMDLAYDADAADREAWAGLSPLPYSEVQAAELRSRERLLFRDIDREGITL